MGNLSYDHRTNHGAGGIVPLRGHTRNVGTNDRSRKKESTPGPLDRLWGLAALPMLPAGLALWGTGIALNAYWVIVGGTITMALGAYKLTEHR